MRAGPERERRSREVRRAACSRAPPKLICLPSHHRLRLVRAYAPGCVRVMRSGDRCSTRNHL
ncbi:hypothetical protein C3492_07175 [Streptomyces sp. Ru62]|nr:hypothetical protein C3492_07175 [Streptomyces sp. Ru62]